MQIVEQRSEQWFKIRRGKITSSEFYKIMGDGKVRETYLLEKISESLGGFAQPATGLAIEWGTELEELASRVYTERTGNKVDRASFISYNDYYGGSPDGLVAPDGIIEIKCPYTSVKHFKHGLIKTDADFKKAFPDYYYQCISNMICAKTQWCDFISYDPRVDDCCQMYIYRLNRDELIIEAMMEKVKTAAKDMDELKDRLQNTINKEVPNVDTAQ